MSPSEFEIYILVPSLFPSGPTKGAIAIANGLASLGLKVHLVAIKGRGLNPNSLISHDVDVFCMEAASFFSALLEIRKLRRMIGSRASNSETKVKILSMGFTADFMSLFLGKHVKKAASVRGDLTMNYSMDYGWIGKLLAAAHYAMFPTFDSVIAMNQEMQTKLRNIGCKRVRMISNFLNEEDYKAIQTPLVDAHMKQLVFLGSLSERKRPMLLLSAFKQLMTESPLVSLVFIGDGPLRGRLQDKIKEHGLLRVSLTGFLSQPMDVVRSSSVMILPSVSEGVPRAVMEALFVGTPCVTRNLPTNDGLIEEGFNGALFDEDAELVPAIKRALKLSGDTRTTGKLLPDKFRQSAGVQQYFDELVRL